MCAGAGRASQLRVDVAAAAALAHGRRGVFECATPADSARVVVRAEAERQQLNLRAPAAGGGRAVSGHGLGLVRWPDDDENGSAVLRRADGAGGGRLRCSRRADDVAVDGEIGDDDD